MGCGATRLDEELEIYEVKSSTEVKDIYLDDVSYQVYILKGLGYNVEAAITDKDSDHEWNAVMIGNNWCLIDVTWGAGSIVNEQFQPSYTDYYFAPLLMNLFELIFQEEIKVIINY